MTTPPNIHAPPTDITRHRNLPMVPRLIDYIKHEPVPWRTGRLDTGGFITSRARCKQFWSGIFEYVPGCDLAHILKHAKTKKYQIPEPMIWEFGKVMLEFVRQLRGTHNDLYARNVLVSNDKTRERSCNFHIIDFGLARKENLESISLRDLRSVCETIKLMMKCHVDHGGQQLRQRDASYSYALHKGLENLDHAVTCPGHSMPRATLLEHLAQFEEGARKAFGSFIKERREYFIDVSTFVVQPPPIHWRKEANPIRHMEERLQNETDVYPCRRAWARNSGSVENWTIEEAEVWGNPKHDPEHNSLV